MTQCYLSVGEAMNKKSQAELDALWSNDAHWTVFSYHCAEDPRLMVSKRPPWMGWTINSAHPQWKAVMGRTITLLLVPSILGVALAIALVTTTPWAILFVPIGGAIGVMRMVNYCRACVRGES